MIPISYTFRNLLNHKITSSLTIFGISLVVFVFAAVLMLADGILKTLVDTGFDDNAVIIRESSQSEVTSLIMRDQADIVSTYPEISTGDDYLPMFTNEIYILITLDKRNDDGTSNVVVRGITEKSLQLHPNIKIIEGRMANWGKSENIAGKSIAKRFKNCEVNQKVKLGSHEWTVVGIFDSQGSAFDSELWGDVEQVQDAFRRPIYSSLTFKLDDPTKITAIRERIEKDPRLPLEIKSEKNYYADQSKATSSFIKIVGIVICTVFAFGAIIGAMITMYAAVANRTREIGTLRSLGFSRTSILTVFLVESLLIAIIGGALGLFGASFLRLIQVSTVNFTTFSELAFNFAISKQIVIISMIFAVLMGFFGGFLPAVRAARLKIVDSLRAL